MQKIQINIYPIETPVYVIANNVITTGLIQKIEIRDDESVFYGVKIPGRKTLLFIYEDDIHITLDSLIDFHRDKFRNQFKSNKV